MKTHLTRRFAILSIALLAAVTWEFSARAENPPTSQPAVHSPAQPNGTPPSGVGAPAPGSGAANASIQWQLGSVVSPWNLTTDGWTELPVTVVAGSSIKEIDLTQSTLVDAGSPGGRVLHANSICLSREPTASSVGSCTQTFPLQNAKGEDGSSPTTKQTIWLSVKKHIGSNRGAGEDKGFNSTGVFTGSLFFDTEPHTDTKSISLTIQQTSCGRQWLGVGTIALGAKPSNCRWNRLAHVLRRRDSMSERS
jgi:hypothetical protein